MALGAFVRVVMGGSAPQAPEHSLRSLVSLRFAPLVSIARPKGTLLLLIVPLLGYGFAHWDFMLDTQRPWALVGVLVAWIALSAGSLWLNAVLDGSEGAALFASGDASVSPAVLSRAGYGALGLSVVLASLAEPRAGVFCAVGAILAALYSHPRTRWKAHPVLGPAVNGLGYGILCWLAGWSVVRVPMTARTAAAMVLLAVFAVGMSFAAQAYQRDDDVRRGYRTLVALRGPDACLRATTLCTRVTLVGVAALALAGVYPRTVVLGMPAFVLAELTMMRWRREPAGGSPAHAIRFALEMLAGGVVLAALATVATVSP